jgi:hypothetical protein
MRKANGLTAVRKHMVAAAALVVAACLFGFLISSFGQSTPVAHAQATPTATPQAWAVPLGNRDGDTTFTNVVATGNLRAEDYVRAGTFLRLDAQDPTVTVPTTPTWPLTVLPTGSWMPMDPAENITVTLSITAANYGDVVIMQNVATYTINMTDSATVLMSANATLGQNDTLMLMFVGEKWVELSRSNN